LVPVDLTVPDPTQISINVRNASGIDGLALKVFVELGRDGFQTLSTTEGYPDPRDYSVAVVIPYGPRTVGAGWLLSSYFRGRVRTQFDVGRSDDRVDVILGKAYTNVLTPTEVHQAVAAAGRPSAPAGTCAVAG
jgi:hypothetical protein